MSTITARVFRWIPRILSLPILLFWGFFLIADLTGRAARSSRSLAANDYLILTGTLISLAGLAVAWRWERGGAVTTLGGCLLFAVVNWRTFASPYLLFPVVAILYLVAWWMNRPPQSLPTT